MECIGLRQGTGRQLPVAFGDCNQHAVVTWVAEGAEITLQVATPLQKQKMDVRRSPSCAGSCKSNSSTCQVRFALMHAPLFGLHACLQQGTAFIGRHCVGSIGPSMW
jgi:hypothetical protein